MQPETDCTTTAWFDDYYDEYLSLSRVLQRLPWKYEIFWATRPPMRWIGQSRSVLRTVSAGNAISLES